MVNFSPNLATLLTDLATLLFLWFENAIIGFLVLENMGLSSKITSLDLLAPEIC